MIAKCRPADLTFCSFHRAVFVVSGIYVLPWANKGRSLLTKSDGMARHLDFFSVGLFRVLPARP